MPPYLCERRFPPEQGPIGVSKGPPETSRGGISPPEVNRCNHWRKLATAQPPSTWRVDDVDAPCLLGILMSTDLSVKAKYLNEQIQNKLAQISG